MTLRGNESLSVACLVIAAALGTPQTASSQAAAVPLPMCRSSNPIVAVGASLLYPGLGHLYIGGGEQRRGQALAITATAGFAFMIGSVIAYAGTQSDAVLDAGVSIGTGTYVLAWTFATADIVPAANRERRRCAGGDRRIGLRLVPVLGTKAANGRSALIVRAVWSVAY